MTHFGTSLTEVPDFGHVVSSKARRHLLGHLFDVAGDHDGPLS